SAVRQPMLLLYTDRFMNEVLMPAQERYDAMKKAVDDAKARGSKVGEYEKALSEVRLKLYEARGFLEDVRVLLSGSSFSLEQIESDLTQAQAIMKSVYAIYKELSLNATRVLNSQ